MGQLDYKLQLLLQKRAADPAPTMPIDGTSPHPPDLLLDADQPVGETQPVRVLLHFKELAPIEALGFKTSSVLGKIAAGSVSIEDLERIGASPDVITMEHARPLKEELDISAETARVTPLRAELDAASTPCRGKGIIIGIIDSGFDFTHQCFSAGPDTRILALWDQNQDASPETNLSFSTPTPPQGFDYGVEYTQAMVNRAVRASNPFEIVPHRPENSHGTHVAGIAAGNGMASPSGRFIGMAPEASLILVSLKKSGQLADSTYAVDAISYLVKKAKSEQPNKPLVINLSQGDNFGPHDGTSLLEQAIDSVLDQPGVAMVKSAGNENGRGSHTRGQVAAGGETTVAFEVENSDKSEDIFDIWYSGNDLFDIAIKPPTGARTSAVAPESSTTLVLPNGNSVYIHSYIKNPENGDNRINLVLERGAGNQIEPGRWEIILIGREVTDGGFHIWIDDSIGPDPRFVEPTLDHTITIPGTSNKIITVGAFIVKLHGAEKPTDLGAVWPSSSIGPTRRGTLKPEISAPGALIMSSRVRTATSPEYYLAMEGTSMAAPHVAGVIALLFEKNPTLTQQQIKDALQDNAIKDQHTGPQPSCIWGHGKLNAQDAYQALPHPTQPGDETMSGPMIITHTETNVPVPITVSLEVQDGAVTGMTGTDSDGRTYEVAFRLKKMPQPGDEGDGEECRCCQPGPGGALSCSDCPCPT